MERIRSFPLEWTRDDWLADRRQGLGGSDIAAIAGMSTFGSPMSVYLDKLGLIPDDGETSRMKWGRLLEPAIAQEFEETTGLYVGMAQALAVDPDRPWQRATLDGIAFDDPVTPQETTALGVVEIKCTEDSGRSWEEELPDRIALQVQWQMGVAGIYHAWLASLHRGNDLRIVEIEYQPAVYAALTTLATRFWHDHVLAEVPPPADSNPATTQALKAAFADPEGDTIELADDVVARAALTDWLRTKAFAAAAKTDLEAIENQLRAALGDNVTATLDGEPVYTWKPQGGAKRLDEAALLADHPDLDLDKYRTQSTHRVLRPTRALKEMQ